MKELGGEKCVQGRRKQFFTKGAVNLISCETAEAIFWKRARTEKSNEHKINHTPTDTHSFALTNTSQTLSLFSPKDTFAPRSARNRLLNGKQRVMVRVIFITFVGAIMNLE